MNAAGTDPIQGRTSRPPADLHRNHLLGLALAAIRKGQVEEAQRIVDEAGPEVLSIHDVFSLYQTELETQNLELLEAHERTEAALGWFSNLFRQLPVAALVLNPAGLIVDANEKAKQDLGPFEQQDIYTLPMRRFLVTLDAEARLGGMLKQATSGRIQSMDHVSMRTLSGELRWVDLRTVQMPPRDQSAQTSLFLCIINDRTAQVEAQRAKEAAAQAEMQRDLAQATSDAKTQLLARVSHEFRTPLNAVIGFSDLLMTGNRHLASEDARRFVQHIRDAGLNLLALVEEVLQINRSFANHIDIPQQAVDLEGMAREAMTLIEPVAAQKGITLTFDPVTSAPPSARAQGRRVREILINLLSNAIKYNVPHGWIRLATGCTEDRAWFSVTDSGIGMNESQLAHLFEPFNRLGAEAREEDGHGLGLCITKTLVDAMQGEIEVTSTPGVGTSFKVSFPAAS